VNGSSADPGCAHPDDHLAVTGGRSVDLAHLQDLGGPVAVLDDCLHGGHVVLPIELGSPFWAPPRHSRSGARGRAGGIARFGRVQVPDRPRRQGRARCTVRGRTGHRGGTTAYLARGDPDRIAETTSRIAAIVEADAVWSPTSISCDAPATTGTVRQTV
jgi:hypothetical protein